MFIDFLDLMRQMAIKAGQQLINEDKRPVLHCRSGCNHIA